MQIIHSTELIIKSILETDILKAVYTTENKTELYIYADKIEKLSDFIGTDKTINKFDYNLVIYLMHCLSKQQLFLESIGYSFYTLCLNDIIVIDDKYFFCIEQKLIMPIDKNKMLTFYKPPLNSHFNSPELLAMNSIPFKTSYKTIYYSFGALAIYCLGKYLNCCKYTKLDWFIRRCIMEDKGVEDKGVEGRIKLRQLLFI